MNEIEAPYREHDETLPVTLTHDERLQLARAGRRMRLGAIVGTGLVAPAIGLALVASAYQVWVLVIAGTVAVATALWLHRVLAAGWALQQLGDGGADYRGLADALGHLRGAFRVRAAASWSIAIGYVLVVVIAILAFATSSHH